MIFIQSKARKIPLKYQTHEHKNAFLTTLHQANLNVQSAANTVSTLVDSKPNRYQQDARLKALNTAVKE